MPHFCRSSYVALAPPQTEWKVSMRAFHFSRQNQRHRIAQMKFLPIAALFASALAFPWPLPGTNVSISTNGTTISVNGTTVSVNGRGVSVNTNGTRVNVTDPRPLGENVRFVIKSPGGRCARLREPNGYVGFGYEDSLPTDAQLCRQKSRHFTLTQRGWMMLDNEVLILREDDRLNATILGRDNEQGPAEMDEFPQFYFSQDGKKLLIRSEDGEPEGKCVSVRAALLAVGECVEESGLVFEKLE